MSEATTQTVPTPPAPPAPPRRSPREWPWERWVPATGIAFVVLIVITFFLPPKAPPKAKDLQDEIAAYYSDHRTAILIAAYLAGLALILFIWFTAILARRLRNAGEPRLGATVLVAGAATVGVAAVMDTIVTALSWRVADDANSDTVKAIFEIQSALMTRIWFPIAALIIAVGIAEWRTQRRPLWYVAGCLVIALFLLVTGAAWAREGFFSPTGVPSMPFIAIILFLIWVLVTSVLLLRDEGVTVRRSAPAAVQA
jgi:uncharacterized membrane protein YhaH (DUF805 family)